MKKTLKKKKQLHHQSSPSRQKRSNPFETSFPEQTTLPDGGEDKRGPLESDNEAGQVKE